MKNKEEIVLLTGATSTIGNAIAKKLSKEYRLVLSGRNLDKLVECKKNLFSPDKHDILLINLKDIDTISFIMDNYLKNNCLSINKLIHCAGLFSIKALKNSSYDFGKEIFNVNLFSAIEIIRSLTGRFNKKSLNNILLISSISAFMGIKGFSYYSASKNSLIAIGKSLAKELAPKIRVNSILPGAIKSESTKNIYNISDILSNYPLGEGKAFDIANLCSYLISNKASWITGQEFIIDGGKTLI